MEIKRVKVEELVVPQRLIYKNEFYKITDYKDRYVTRGYTVVLVNEKIDELVISNVHPNANPKTGEFCIPHSLRKFPLGEETKKMIHSMLSCFNLDDCFFTPWNEIQYQKQEV